MTCCSLPNCDKRAFARGLCEPHYLRLRKLGDPAAGSPIRRPNGTGTLGARGYIQHGAGGVRKPEHVLVAEKALGKPLPAGARVHHVDEDKTNNAPANLVICPSEAYHQLLHQRMRALAACGHAHWRRCTYCQQYAPPEELALKGTKQAWHRTCRNEHSRTIYQQKGQQ